MTDTGKYSYSLDPTSGAATMKEVSLRKQLEDTEFSAQDLRVALQEARDDAKRIELQLQKKETEHQGSRREAINATEQNKRLQEQLKESAHRINLYRVETEELIKQIDMADAKAREKEDALVLREAEFERNLKSQEERILFRRGKGEEREVLDLKREHGI